MYMESRREIGVLFGKWPIAQLATVTEAAEAAAEEQNDFKANEGDKVAEVGNEGGEESTEDKSKPKALLRPLLPCSQKNKRPHRKTHGKISFHLLIAQMVQGGRISDEKRKHYTYQDLAQEDMKRQK